MTKPLEVFPYSCTKKQLVQMYLDQMKEADILRAINLIIIENRKLPQDQPVYKMRIWHKELKEFVRIYEAPRGYTLPETFRL